MDLSELIPIFLIVLVVVAVWAVVELALTFRRARSTVENANEAVDTAKELLADVRSTLEPTLARIDPMMEQIQPAAARIDPMMEHVQLTIDAANLELMRLDQILDDVSKVSGVAGKTAASVDAITSAPAELITSAVERLRGTAKDASRQVAAKRALSEMHSSEGGETPPGSGSAHTSCAEGAARHVTEGAFGNAAVTVQKGARPRDRAAHPTMAPDSAIPIAAGTVKPPATEPVVTRPAPAVDDLSAKSRED